MFYIIIGLFYLYAIAVAAAFLTNKDEYIGAYCQFVCLSACPFLAGNWPQKVTICEIHLQVM